MNGQGTGLAALDPKILEAVRPTTLAREQLLDVPEALSPLFPWGGLQRGWQMSVSGPGAWTLTAGMMVPSLGDEGWMAVMGSPLLNLVAGAEVGLRMDRVLVVDTPPAGQWGTVVAALLEAVQVVVVSPSNRIGNRDARRISARLREQRGTLIYLEEGSARPRNSEGRSRGTEGRSRGTEGRPRGTEGRSRGTEGRPRGTEGRPRGTEGRPSGTDMGLRCCTEEWLGIGEGSGYLRHRRITVEANGRRAAAQARSVSLWMPGPDGPLTPAPTLATVTELPRR